MLRRILAKMIYQTEIKRFGTIGYKLVREQFTLYITITILRIYGRIVVAVKKIKNRVLYR